MLLVDNLGYNFLRVSQLCDKDLYVLSKRYECLVLEASSNFVFKGRTYNDIILFTLKKIDNSKLNVLKLQMIILGCCIEDFVIL